MNVLNAKRCLLINGYFKKIVCVFVNAVAGCARSTGFESRSEDNFQESILSSIMNHQVSLCKLFILGHLAGPQMATLKILTEVGERESEVSLKLRGNLAHTFNPSAQEAEADRSL